MHICENYKHIDSKGKAYNIIYEFHRTTDKSTCFVCNVDFIM